MLTSPRASALPRTDTRNGNGSRRSPKIGVLMLHGLGGSPAELYPLASELTARGYRVSSPRLDGLSGGTDHDDRTQWSDWLRLAEAEYDLLEKQCDEVHVCGFCGGALLAALLANSGRRSFGDMVLISPTFTADGWSVPYSLQLYKLVTMRWLARLFKFKDRPPFGLKDERMRVVVRRMLERTHKPEERFFEISGVKMMEFNRLARVARKALNKIRSRTLIVHARLDDVSSLGNAELIARKIGARAEILVLDDCYHEVLLDAQRVFAIQSIVNFFAATAMHQTVRERDLEFA